MSAPDLYPMQPTIQHGLATSKSVNILKQRVKNTFALVSEQLRLKLLSASMPTLHRSQLPPHTLEVVSTLLSAAGVELPSLEDLHQTICSGCKQQLWPIPIVSRDTQLTTLNSSLTTRFARSPLPDKEFAKAIQVRLFDTFSDILTFTKILTFRRSPRC